MKASLPVILLEGIEPSLIGAWYRWHSTCSWQKLRFPHLATDLRGKIWHQAATQ